MTHETLEQAICRIFKERGLEVQRIKFEPQPGGLAVHRVVSKEADTK